MQVRRLRAYGPVENVGLKKPFDGAFCKTISNLSVELDLIDKFDAETASLCLLYSAIRRLQTVESAGAGDDISLATSAIAQLLTSIRAPYGRKLALDADVNVPGPAPNDWPG